MALDLRVTPQMLEPGKFPKVGQHAVGYVARNGNIYPGPTIRAIFPNKKKKDGKDYVVVGGVRIEPVEDEDGDELLLTQPWESRTSAWYLEIATGLVYYWPCDPDVPGAKPDGDGDADDA